MRKCLNFISIQVLRLIIILLIFHYSNYSYNILILEIIIVYTCIHVLILLNFFLGGVKTLHCEKAESCLPGEREHYKAFASTTDGLWDSNLIWKSICACTTPPPPPHLFVGGKIANTFLPIYRRCRIKNERVKQPISTLLGDSWVHCPWSHATPYVLKFAKSQIRRTADEGRGQSQLIALYSRIVGARSAKAR